MRTTRPPTVAVVPLLGDWVLEVGRVVPEAHAAAVVVHRHQFIQGLHH